MNIELVLLTKKYNILGRMAQCCHVSVWISLVEWLSVAMCLFGYPWQNGSVLLCVCLDILGRMAQCCHVSVWISLVEWLSVAMCLFGYPW